MSTLTTLKHRARVLAAAVALSAATLALSPGVAEATGTCTCTDGGSTGGSTVDGSNTNTSIGNVGQITGQDLVDLGDINLANNNNAEIGRASCRERV